MNITVSQLQKTYEVGSCNACTRQTDEHGSVLGSMVYVVTFWRTKQNSQSFNICEECSSLLCRLLLKREVMTLEDKR